MAFKFDEWASPRLPRENALFGVFTARDLKRNHQPMLRNVGLQLAPQRWKRAFDVVFTAAILIFVSPLLAMIIIGLLITDGCPIFFRQTRIGYGGQRFSCVKFRTMVTDADAQLQNLLSISTECRQEWAKTQKLRSDPRIHWLGRLLRKSSLDELPQFLCVLRGDMSVVGPRPIIEDEIARYGAQFAGYSSVRPGITGLWQVSGRNSLSYSERVALDIRYIDDISPNQDIKIILKTVKIVFTGSGDH